MFIFCYNTTQNLTAQQHTELKAIYLQCVSNFVNNTMDDMYDSSLQFNVDETINLVAILATYNAQQNTLTALETFVDSVSATDSYVRDYFVQFFNALESYAEENYAGEWD